MLRSLILTVLLLSSGCATRQGWGFPWGQGTVDRQKTRAVIHDPYPLNDIGPEVVGGRPREFMTPLPEAKRNQIGAGAARSVNPYGQPAAQFPPTFQFPNQ
jgi:hypothetical protein